MEKMIPHKKLQKKKQKEIAAKKRGSWGDINPITRKKPNSKAYNRKKAGRWNEKSNQDLPFKNLYKISLIHFALRKALISIS
ncbi:MAG TPA: hypothetical protein DIW17_10240 [Clostridiales bacterium]|nr:hypothetical protein [Clostridia bacterium]HCS74241.1 hypothetical protein [Clostridiales bacterium]